MKIGCIQKKIIAGDIKANFTEYVNDIVGLSHQHIDVILLPEMWVCGFDYQNLTAIASESNNIIASIQSLIGENSVVVSSMPEIDNNNIYNSVFAFDKKSIVSKYRKNFLFSPQKEDQYFTKGDGISLFSYKGCNFSLHTCYEIRFPELFRMSAYEGSYVMLVPAVWPNVKKEHWLTLLRSRAIENQCYVVGCNTSGLFTGKKTIGCGFSAAFDPWGVEIFNGNEDENCFTFEVDTAKINSVRSDIPSLNDAKACFTINKVRNCGRI